MHPPAAAACRGVVDRDPVDEQEHPIEVARGGGVAQFVGQVRRRNIKDGPQRSHRQRAARHRPDGGLVPKVYVFHSQAGPQLLEHLRLPQGRPHHVVSADRKGPLARGLVATTDQRHDRRSPSSRRRLHPSDCLEAALRTRANVDEHRVRRPFFENRQDLVHRDCMSCLEADRVQHGDQ
jgi:hypothetical protein